MNDPTDGQIDDLLKLLDDISREFNGYEFGIPLFDVPDDPAWPLPRLRDGVRRWTRATFPSTVPPQRPEEPAG